MDSGVDLHYPFSGRWLVQNSPADRIPSHGTRQFASSWAIDFVPAGDGSRTAPMTLAGFFRPEPPERFPGFGRPILAPIDGAVVAVHDAEPDHPAYRGLPSIGYAVTQHRRAAAGWGALAGNHVFIEHRGIVIALCHLQWGSGAVRAGDHVRAGDLIGRCGNSGNSTEPHLHIQAFAGRSIEDARAVPMTFRGALPRNGTIVLGGSARSGE